MIGFPVELSHQIGKCAVYSCSNDVTESSRQVKVELTPPFLGTELKVCDSCWEKFFKSDPSDFSIYFNSIKPGKV